jgi:hypothetical protein
MPVTLNFAPKRKSKNGKYEAQPRMLQINLKIDLTQEGQLTYQKAAPLIEGVLAGTRESLKDVGLGDGVVTADWSWVYGPWFYGDAS